MTPSGHSGSLSLEPVLEDRLELGKAPARRQKVVLRGHLPIFQLREALVVRSQRYRASYREFWQQTTELARALMASGVEAGDRLEFVEEEKGVYKVVAATKDVRHLKGIIQKPGRPVSVEEMNRVVRRSGGKR